MKPNLRIGDDSMENLIIKEVDFNGDNLMAVQENDSGKIYVGVKWVCEGLGLTSGQFKSERLKIQNDLVLRQVGRKIVLPTSGGNKGVLCIELDFLPLWLAKISITPQMQKVNPKLAEKLIAYQLNVKGVLAEAFLSKKRKQPTGYELMARAVLEAQEFIDGLNQEI